MKLVNLKCPECSAQLKVDPSREFIYCEYCGTKILLDREEKVTRTIDEAAIRQAEADIRKAEAEEKIELKKIRADQINGIILLIMMIVLIISLFLLFYYGDKTLM